MSLSGAPRMSSMGVRMCAPVIMELRHGRAEEEIPAADPGLDDVWWCQGYVRAGLGVWTSPASP